MTAKVNTEGMPPLQGASPAPKRSRASTRWADRVMTLIWLSALSLALDGFATYATGTYPTTPRDPPPQADSTNAPPDATPQQRLHHWSAR